ncbi:MAG: type II toxin-antitoxin system prevent-host-death family antitoxin [Dermatophilaceae bacterium]
MTEIGSYQAKTHLPRLLDEVAAGASYIITKHGRPVARLVSADPRTVDGPALAAALRAARRGVTRGERSVRDMVELGRR